MKKISQKKLFDLTKKGRKWKAEPFLSLKKIVFTRWARKIWQVVSEMILKQKFGFYSQHTS